MSDTHDPDDILADRLLAPPDAAAAEPLRQTVFARTLPVLRRRRLARRLAAVAALAACYAAGLLSAHWLAPPPQGVKHSVVQHRPAARPRQPERPASLEQQARADAARRSALYRRAGDLYATEQGDLEAALRCYGRSLDDRPAKDLALEPTDHWLLMAIKDAREKEKVYAKSEH